MHDPRRTLQHPSLKTDNIHHLLHDTTCKTNNYLHLPAGVRQLSSSASTPVIASAHCTCWVFTYLLAFSSCCWISHLRRVDQTRLRAYNCALLHRPSLFQCVRLSSSCIFHRPLIDIDIIHARPTERETKICESKNIQNTDNMKEEGTVSNNCRRTVSKGSDY